MTHIRSLIVTLTAFGFAACGPTPPDYGALARYSVEACGEVHSAADIVRWAYDKEPRGSLPSDIAIPRGTVAVSTLDESGTERIRRYPCARDAEHALEVLEDHGYRSATVVRDDEQVILVEARDKYGIEGIYSLFPCEFVEAVSARRLGSIYQQGLFGAFGENGEDHAPERMIRDLASVTFASGMTPLANEGYLRYVDGVTLLSSDVAVELGAYPGLDEEVPGIGVCAIWVEPNFSGGCDAVRVGRSRTVALNNGDREFHQIALSSVFEGFYGFAGWCGRRE